MPLTSCPECARQVSTHASSCPGCGHPLGGVAQAETKDPARYDRRSSIRACGNCGSDSLKKLSLIYEGGFSATEGVSKGIGLTLGGSLGVGAAKSVGTSQTALSARVAPPAKKKVHVLIYLLGVFGLTWMMAGFGEGGAPQLGVMGMLVVASCGYVIYTAHMFNKNTWPSLWAEWDRSFMCERCGNIAPA
jgi:hypothetical protein